MNKILVATDFSIRANNALSLAKVIASKTQGSITLIHVVELPGRTHTSTEDVLNADQRTDVYILKLIEKAEKELEVIRVANSVDSIKINVEIRMGEPYKEIREYVDSHEIDLVLAGDKGHSEFEDIFIGSLSDKLVRTMDCPVVTVKAAIADGPLKNILYVVNGDHDEEPIMVYLKALNQYFNAKIHLVWINTPYDFKDDSDTKPWLYSLAHQYFDDNYAVSVYNHHDKDFGVVYIADEVKADLIALGITNRSMIQRFITGDSLAEDVSDHTIRPVLTLKLK